MKRYVVEHFHDEEEYQRSIDYPGYEYHKEIHNGMSIMCRRFQGSTKSPVIMGADAAVRRPVLAWLINHVAAEDQRIADHARKRGEGGNEG